MTTTDQPPTTTATTATAAAATAAATAPGAALIAVYDAMAVERRAVGRWPDLPLALRGSLRVMWAHVRAGQTDPRLIALAGIQYRQAFYPPDPADPDTESGRAMQYLSFAFRLTTAAATTSAVTR